MSEAVSSCNILLISCVLQLLIYLFWHMFLYSYCDCFAAGAYCADACSCLECFNRPNNEDKVMETKKKIESRDPFAFAPRVVQHIIEQSPNISCGVFF